MKKSLVTLAILAAAGVASAQSSVTLYGTVDVAYQHGTGDVSSVTRLGNNAHSMSHFGFRGTEDLGGGMSAGFVLESWIFPASGSGWGTAVVGTGTDNQGRNAGPTPGSLSFNGRSTVSLASGMGELRLGRDFTPQFYNHGFDPFRLNGVGASQAWNSAAGTNPASLQVSNSISYFLPGNLGGFSGQFQHYLGGNASGNANSSDGTGSGIRVGYANGPIDVAVATSRTQYSQSILGAGPSSPLGDVTSTNLGGSYNFGVAKAVAYMSRDYVASVTAVATKGMLIGAVVPMGVGQISTTYSNSKTDAVGTPKTNKFALGYEYHLSKRTTAYTAFARVTNSGGASAALNGATTSINQSSSGYDIGLRHSF